MSAEHWSNLKPEPLVCATDGCGIESCTAVGQPTRNGHVRGCTSKCAKCRGRRNRKAGLRKQNVARKALGVPASKFGDSNEERWSDNVWANECKSGAQVGPVKNWWLRVEKQVHANESTFGDRRRPVRAIAMPEGMSDGLVVVRLSAWNELVRPALEEFYGPEGGAA